MIVKYPIFGQDKDKWMFVVETEDEVSSDLEVIDVENKEYVGWDIEGKSLEFYIDSNQIKVRCLSEDHRIDELKQAILNYAKVARHKEDFFVSGNQRGVRELFDAVEGHINKGRFPYQAVMKLKEIVAVVQKFFGIKEVK